MARVPTVGIHGDPELTGLPGTTSLWGSHGEEGAGAVHLAGGGLQGCMASGYKNPEVLGCAGLRHNP